MPKLLSDTQPRTVLVLDADQASALAIVRSLGRHGIPVQVASDLPRPLAGHSRHAQGVLRYPDPLRCGPDFVAWLATQLQVPPRLGHPCH